MKIILNLPKLFIIFLLLIFFMIFEGLVVLVYYIVESPLAFVKYNIEKVIRKLLKYVR